MGRGSANEEACITGYARCDLYAEHGEDARASGDYRYNITFPGGDPLLLEQPAQAYCPVRQLQAVSRPG